MNSPLLPLTRFQSFAVLLIGCATLLPACAMPLVCRTGKCGMQQGPQSNPILAAARAQRINLFGEMGDNATTEYFTRPSVSLKQHTFSEIGGDIDPDLDATGQRLVFASTRHSLSPDLYMKSVDGVAVTQLTSDPSSDLQPTFSPDGKYVAFASDRSGNWDIWVVNVDGGQPVQITDDLGDDIHPSWSPDGQKLVYCSLPPEAGQWELWITDAHSGPTRKLIGDGLFPEWSPQGNTIIFQRARERESRRFSVWTLTLLNGEPRYPTELASSPRQAYVLPTWNADGTLVAFTALAEPPAADGSLPTSSDTIDLWLMSAEGRNRVRLTDGRSVNYAPAFSPDGRIFFSSRRKGNDNIWSLWPTEFEISPADIDQPQGFSNDVTHAGGRFNGPVAQGGSVKGDL